MFVVLHYGLLFWGLILSSFLLHLTGRSKVNAISGPSLGAPALTGPLGLQRTPSDVSLPVSEASVRVDGSWSRRRRGRRNPHLFVF